MPEAPAGAGELAPPAFDEQASAAPALTERAAARAPGPERDSARRALGVPAAQLAAWSAIAVVDACVIAASLRPHPGGRTVRLLHHLYDAGQLLALGLFSAAAVALWSRFGPRRRWAAHAALAAASMAAGWLALADDLRSFAERITPAGRETPLLAPVLVFASLSIPLAAVAGRLLSRRWWLRLAGFGAAMGVAAANHFVLQKDYPGVHLFAAWNAAVLAGAALAGARLPGRLSAIAASPWPRHAVGAVALAAGAWAVAVPAPNAVLARMLERSGCVAAPFVSRFHAARRARAAIPVGADPWFDDRGDAEPAPPSARLMGEDAIVLLFTIDCMRADLLDDARHAERLPHLSALARSAKRFTMARSTAPATSVSLSSLFAGRYYSQLYWSDTSTTERPALSPSRDPGVRFPELLARAGVPTVTYAGAAGLENDTGIVRGFTEQAAPRRGGYALASTIADFTVRRLRHAGPGPLFLFAHFLDAHAPYDRAGKEGSPFDRYLGELGLVDDAIGRVLQVISERGLAARTAVIVTADHGEAFGEHGTTHHAVSVYDELVRVPLLVRVPGLAPGEVDAPVSLIDLAPTILDLFGQATPGGYMGQSLLPSLSGGAASLSRPIAVDSGRLVQAMVFPDGYKIIWHKREHLAELYDLRRDPGELENMFDSDPAGVEKLAALRAFFQTHEHRRPGYEVPFRTP